MRITRVIHPPNLTMIKVAMTARPLRKICVGVNTLYSRTECVFILEHYFVLKSSASVRETFRNVYPDKEVRQNTTTGNKMSGHRKWMHRNVEERPELSPQKSVRILSQQSG
jgi:hypothetical protein